jgi:hypothetical protein
MDAPESYKMTQLSIIFLCMNLLFSLEPVRRFSPFVTVICLEILVQSRRGYSGHRWRFEHLYCTRIWNDLETLVDFYWLFFDIGFRMSFQTWTYFDVMLFAVVRLLDIQRATRFPALGDATIVAIIYDHSHRFPLK